jgi:OPA family sugar phosphate sensor protein UhpC-like MFS transporter
MIALGGSAIAQYFGWRITMIAPGILSIIVGIIVWTKLVDDPISVGITSIGLVGKKETEKVESKKDIFKKYVLSNSNLWLISLASFLQYVVKQAISDWGVLFLIETKQFSSLTAGSCMVFFELAGTVGGVSAGVISDRLFQGNRGPINVTFTSLVGVGVSLALRYIYVVY